MVVVHFTVVELAQQTLVKNGLGGLELAGETALETDAAKHLVGFCGVDDVPAFLERHAEGFLDDEVLSRAGGGHRLVAVLGRHGANVHHLDVGSEELVEVRVSLDRAAVAGADFRIVELAGREDGGDLGVRGGVDRRDVGTCAQPYPMIPTLYFFMLLR